VLGTGLKECIISGLLSVSGMKVCAPSLSTAPWQSKLLVPAVPFEPALFTPLHRYAGAAHGPQQLLRGCVSIPEPHTGETDQHGSCNCSAPSTPTTHCGITLDKPKQHRPAVPTAALYLSTQPPTNSAALHLCASQQCWQATQLAGIADRL
jgi:hypothetical protein